MIQRTKKIKHSLSQYWPIATTLTAVFGSFFIASGLYFSIQSQKGINSSLINDAEELKVFSAQLPSIMKSTTRSENSFDILHETLKSMSLHSAALSTTPLSVFPLEDKLASQQLQSLKTTWRLMKEDIEQVINLKKELYSIRENIILVQESIPTMQLEYDDVVEILLTTEASSDQVAIAQRQSWLAEKILSDTQSVMRFDSNIAMIFDSLSRNTELFKKILDASISRSNNIAINPVTSEAALDRLSEVTKIFNIINSNIKNIIANKTNLENMSVFFEQTEINSKQLIQQSSVFIKTIKQSGPLNLIELTFIVSIALSFILFGLTMSLIRYNSNKKIYSLRKLYKNNHNSMINLAGQITAIANGDLTVKASLDNNLTKNVAESINFSANQIKSLVQSVSHTATEAHNAAHHTSSYITKIAEVTEHQHHEIIKSADSIHQITEAIENTTANVANSKIIAKRSVDLSNNNHEVVKSTLMSIKKVKKNSQKTFQYLTNINNASQIINDFLSTTRMITEQTKILSLNVAIQASMVGDQGKRFTNIVEEIQRLHERISSTTKQLEDLGATIQTNTGNAISSITQTDTGIIDSLRLMEKAQIYSEKSDQSNHNILELIESISKTLEYQSLTVTEVLQQMEKIKLMSINSNTNPENQSVSNLTNVAGELNQIVSKFNLPDFEKKELEEV